MNCTAMGQRGIAAIQAAGCSTGPLQPEANSLFNFACSGTEASVITAMATISKFVLNAPVN